MYLIYLLCIFVFLFNIIYCIILLEMEKFMKSDLNFLLSNLIAHRGYHSLNKSVTENSFPVGIGIPFVP